MSMKDCLLPKRKKLKLLKSLSKFLGVRTRKTGNVFFRKKRPINYVQTMTLKRDNFTQIFEQKGGEERRKNTKVTHKDRKKMALRVNIVRQIE